MDTRLLLEVSEVADLLGVSRATVYELVAAGELRPVRIGRAVRFRPEDLEAFVRRLAAAETGAQ